METDLESIEGIGAKTAAILIENGFTTITSIAAASPRELASIEGITESLGTKMIMSANELSDGVLGLSFKTGEELLEEYRKRNYLTSGCKSLDDILGGGFSTQKLYEFWGPEGTGKSNILHQLVCTAALPVSKGGLGGGAIYIDAENALSLKRIRDIAPRFGLDPEAVVKGISRTVPGNSDALKYMCDKVLSMQIEQTDAKIVVLDSIATHFRSEFGALRQDLPRRQQKANQILHSLKKWVKIYNIVAVITNQATGDPTGIGSGIKHSMGHVIGHESEVRIKITIKSSKEHKRQLIIEKAVDLPRELVILKLLKDGFHDLDEGKKTRTSGAKKKTTIESKDKPTETRKPKLTTRTKSTLVKKTQE